MRDRVSQKELAEQIALVALAVSEGRMIVVDMKTHGRIDGYIKIDLELWQTQGEPEQPAEETKPAGETLQ